MEEWKHQATVLSYLAGAIVFLYAALNFNTPPTNRSSTTFLRFWVGAILYACAAVITWAFLSWLPPGLLDRFFNWPPEIEPLTRPLGVALVLSGLAPAVPQLRSLDAKIRVFFHQIARVVEEAEEFAARLRVTPLASTTRVIDEVTEHLLREGFVREDLHFLPTRDTRSLWTRVTALQLGLESWGRNRRAVLSFFTDNHSDYERLKSEYAALTRSARLRFELLRVFEGEEVSTSLLQTMQRLESELKEEAEAFEVALHHFIARAVLQVGRFREQRNRLVDALGFRRIEFPPDRFFDQLLGLFLALLVYYSFLLFFVGKGFLIGVGVALVYVGAVSAAIYPKRWQFFRPEGGRQITAYSISALAGAVLWLVVFTAVWTIAGAGSVAQIRTKLTANWSWIVMVLVTAFASGGLADRAPGGSGRLVNSALQALVTGVAALVTVFLREATEASSTSIAEVWANLWENRGEASRIVFSATATGAAIGWWVPYWYSCRIKLRASLPADPACWTGVPED